MRNITPFLILIIISICQSFAQLANSAWPTVNNNLQRTGISSYKGPTLPLKKWIFTTNAVICTSPIIGADGTIYIGSDKFYAINPDGSQKWAINIITKSSPTISADDTIYIGSTDNKIYALNSIDGSQKWSFNTGGPIQWSSPAIDSDGTIYVGSEDNKLYAIKPDGTLKWVFTTGDKVWSSPAIGADGTIYFGSTDRKFYALRKDGTQKWSYTTGGVISANPVISTDGTIYIGSWNDNKIYAFNTNGTVKWSFTTGSWVTSSPTIGLDGSIYVASCDNKVYSLAPNGKEKWSFTTGKPIQTSPIIDVNGIIYVSSNDKKIYAINPDGTEKWSFTTGDILTQSPSISSDGTLYVASNDNKLYAITNGIVKPSLTLTSPNGGETWYRSNSYPITWTSTGIIGNVKIELFKSGVLNNTIITNVSNTGSYNWNIPANQVTGSDYRIKISEVADLTVNNQSATDFTISTGMPAKGQWPMFGYDIQHTGQSPYTGPSIPKQKWLFKNTAYVQTVPIIDSNGTIYIGGQDNKLHAVNSDGTEKWVYNTGSFVESSPAINTDGTIYFGSRDNNFYALNLDGTKKWTIKIGKEVVSSPVIGKDGTIYFGSYDGKLYALNPNGTQKWTTFITSSGSSPAIGTDGTIYIGSNKVYAIDQNGTIKWTFGNENFAGSSPSIDKNGIIYIGSAGSNNVYAIKPDGTQKWKYTTGGIVNSIVISEDNTVYLCSRDGYIYAINIDGTKKWSFNTNANAPGRLAIDKNGTLYSGWDNRNVYALNPNGTKKWVFATSSSSRNISIGEDNTIYVGNEAIYETVINSILFINSPNGGEQWQQGSSNSITWTSTATPGNVKIELFKNDIFNSIITNDAPNTGTFNWNIPANQTPGNDYRVKITSLTDTKVTDSSNDDFAIIADSTSLGIPIQISPIKNAVNVTIPTSLVWLPVTSAVSYQYELYGPSSITIPIETLTVSNTSATIQYSLNTNTKYNWRVRAISANNTQGAFSPLWSFTTIKPSLLPPTLISPPNNSVDIPINTKFVWTSVLDAVAYDIELSKDAGFTNKVLLDSPTTTLTTLLAYSTKYYWRARGKNGNNLGLWSTIFTFTTADFIPISGIDAAIRNSKLGSPSFGFGVINDTGILQTVTIDQEINRQSEFDVIIKNTGNVPDIFLITSSSTIDNGLNSKWKIAVYDINGENRTNKIFNGGWVTYNIKPGESVTLRLRIAASSKQIIDSANPPTKSISISAQSMNDIQNGVTTPASDKVIGIAILVKRSNQN